MGDQCIGVLVGVNAAPSVVQASAACAACASSPAQSGRLGSGPGVSGKRAGAGCVVGERRLVTAWLGGEVRAPRRLPSGWRRSPGSARVVSGWLRELALRRRA
jgi:hypothetical protein